MKRIYTLNGVKAVCYVCTPKTELTGELTLSELQFIGGNIECVGNGRLVRACAEHHAGATSGESDLPTHNQFCLEKNRTQFALIVVAAVTVEVGIKIWDERWRELFPDETSIAAHRGRKK